MKSQYLSTYYGTVLALLEQILESERDVIVRAGCVLADTIQQDGLIHVFGCGHSHMVCEELFYRAGGLACIDPIFEQSVMLHDGAYKSSHIERMADYAADVVSRYPIEAGDTFLAISTSGINSFPIEAAETAKRQGATVVGITSSCYWSGGACAQRSFPAATSAETGSTMTPWSGNISTGSNTCNQEVLL